MSMFLWALSFLVISAMCEYLITWITCSRKESSSLNLETVFVVIHHIGLSYLKLLCLIQIGFWWGYSPGHCLFRIIFALYLKKTALFLFFLKICWDCHLSSLINSSSTCIYACSIVTWILWTLPWFLYIKPSMSGLFSCLE